MRTHTKTAGEGAREASRGFKGVRGSSFEGETSLEPGQASEGDSKWGEGLEKGKRTFERLGQASGFNSGLVRRLEASYRGLGGCSKGADLLSKGRGSTLKRDSKAVGAGFAVEVGASRRRNEVVWGGSQSEGGFEGEDSRRGEFEGESLACSHEALQPGGAGCLKPALVARRGDELLEASSEGWGVFFEVRGSASKGGCEGDFELELPWEHLLERDQEYSTGASGL
ncbi:hypothetical protein EDD15DRAFT_2516918 [Pisolithus albus]|nr:hypothetical protein EDD15DRAFT_2516918 [Pisolithus albus]